MKINLTAKNNDTRSTNTTIDGMLTSKINVEVLNPIELINKINDVLNDEKKYNDIKVNLKKISMDNSSDVIYKKLKELIKW